MTQSTKIDAGVEELIQRIRHQTEHGDTAAGLELIRDSESNDPLSPMSSAKHLTRKSAGTEKLAGLIENARSKIEVGGAVPRFLHGLFRKQGAFNRLVLESLKLLLKTVTEMHKRLSDVVDAHRDAQARWSESLAQTNQQHDVIARDLAATGDRIRALQTHGEVTQIASRAAITQLEREVDQLRRNADALRVAYGRADERQLADSSYFKAQLSLFTQLLRAQSKDVPKTAMVGPADPAPIQANELDQRLADTFYVAFEDAFRGNRADIKRRQEIYLPYVRSGSSARPSLPVLDLGCGRGEWLELLGENEHTARGVDLNRTMIDYCLARGLDATFGDALEYLKQQADGTFAAVTAFHLIEHLPLPLLIELLREALRVLAPGGSLICETPNPANIQVGAHFFYRDPTHQRPLPPDSTRFLALHVGFREADILPVNPCDIEIQIPADGLEVTDRFNKLFYGAQDYAIIGTK